MNRKRVLIAVAALVALMAILGFVLRSRRNGDTTFRTGKIEQGNIEQTVSATGQLSAVKTVQVGTQVSGKVTQSPTEEKIASARATLKDRLEVP